MNRYWKADAATSKKIIALLNQWDAVAAKARKLALRHGATTKLYTTSGFATRYVSGFIFKDKSMVDRKLFVPLKDTSDGWRPRRIKNSTLCKEFEELKSDFMADVMRLIGIPLFNGAKWHTPGIAISGKTVYLTTHNGLKSAKGCKRISDVAFEKATMCRKTSGE